MLWLYQKIRMARRVLRVKDTPRQMAAGLACGLLLGLIPKGNLLAFAVATTLLATRMSFATGMACAFLISMIAPLCDPLTHRIGQWILTNSAIVPLWQSLARLPLAAWTSFNNTVVMGSLALGTILMYPVYRLSLPWMECLHRKYAEADDPGAAADAPVTLPTEATDAGLEPDSARRQLAVADPPPHQRPRRARSGRQRSCA